MLETICRLGRKDAIKAIKYEDKVYLKTGIWNEYELMDREEAEFFIKNSEIGADVRVNEKGEYYVSCPYASDMW